MNEHTPQGFSQNVSARTLPRRPLWTICAAQAAWLLLVAGKSVAQDAAPVINEFMASNATTLYDEDGDASDWIELHNPTGQAIDLGGWALTDDEDEPNKWVFSSKTLNAGEYFVVFASGKDHGSAGETPPVSRTGFHANFRLARSGEYLALVNPSGEVVSGFAPEYPEQRRDVSYGLIDGGYAWFDMPTPGAANVAGMSVFLEPPTFSAAGALLEEPFALYLFSETPGSIVRYTVDGTEPSETNGTPYAQPIYVDETTVVRAAAFMDGAEPSTSVTRTYIFPKDVIRQPPGRLGLYECPLNWICLDEGFEMDPEVVQGRESDMIAALVAVPSFSIVLPFDSLFDVDRGIYTNADEYGREWERPASIELIYPSDFPPETDPKAQHGGRDGFAVNGGVRIRGGWSRSAQNPKHAFRLYFRSEYGPSKLSYALFGDEGVDEFDKFDLRTAQNYSWSFYGSPANTMVREVFSRDTQRDMGVPYTRSRYYHLYLNGQYWGVFQSQERPDNWHGAAYLGGSPDDYDVVKSGGLRDDYLMEISEGSEDAWRLLYDEANRLAALPDAQDRDALYMKLQGLNPDGSRNPDYPALLDADNLIQYMLIVFWTGSTDAPIMPAGFTNNFFGVRSRSGERGFAWFTHDMEHTLFVESEFGDGHDRTGPFLAGHSFEISNPQWIHQQLMGSDEYRLRFADLAQRHFFGDGALTADAAIARWDARTDEVRPIILAESARWGDSKRESPLTPDDWQQEIASVRDEFLSSRTPVVFEQLKRTQRFTDGLAAAPLLDAPLYPSVDAPSFSHPEGESSDPFTLTMQAPAGGTIFYTLNGADPRLIGGDVSAGAMEYDNAGVSLSGYNRVRARVRANDGAWSALEEAEYFAGVASPVSSRLVVSEIHYNPTEPTEAEIAAGFDDNDDFEFIELHNPSGAAVSLGGLAFTDGIAFAFGEEMLAPGARIVVVANESAFRMRYGPEANVAGSYASGRLNNAGETLVLAGATGEPVVRIEYNDGGAWPARADGGGSSLTLNPANANDPDRAAAWRASVEYDGSPGAAGRDAFRDVVVNEALAHSDAPDMDAVELHNSTAQAIDIGGWLLSDGMPLDKYRIPDGTTIEAGGYLVLDENDFNAPGADNGFAFSSARGDKVRLVAADAEGNPTLFADDIAFGATRTGVTIGRPAEREDAFVPLAEPTLGGPNSAARRAQVVFREIMYHPPGNNPNLEYVALYNTGDATENLSGWTLRKGVDFVFPEGIQLAPGDSVFVTAFDPATEPENAATFRLAYDWSDARRLIGGWEGRLANEGETLELNRPDDPPADDPAFVPETLEERVAWSDAAPWPAIADGDGSALRRTNVAGLAGDPANWGAIRRTVVALDVERSPETPIIPGEYALSPAYPNPTRGMSRTHLTVGKTQHVRATLYDMLGREVYRVLDGTVPSGAIETLAVNGANLASGIYILRVRGENFSAMQSFTVAR